ncbi:MAG: glycosyltransferase [Treponema sp.]|nr:glycosyltransferase [Treponema sp.]
MSILLSIVTINYNNKAGLQKTLQSVAAQTDGNYEHIIIDGGSTDGSVDVIRELLEDENYARHVSFWCSEPDDGIYPAINKGIPHINGDYCLILNSGDYLSGNDSLQKINRHMFDEDIVSFNYYRVGKGYRRFTTQAKKMTPAFWYLYDGLNHQSCLIKSSIQKTHPYPTDYKIRNDSYFFMQLFLKYNCTYRHIDETISCYNDQNGVSAVADKKLMETERSELLKRFTPPQFVDDLKDYATLYIAVNRRYKGVKKIISFLEMLHTVREKLHHITKT